MRKSEERGIAWWRVSGYLFVKFAWSDVICVYVFLKIQDGQRLQFAAVFKGCFLKKPRKFTSWWKKRAGFLVEFLQIVKDVASKVLPVIRTDLIFKKHTWKTILIVNCKLLWQWWTYFRYVNNQKMFVLCELLLVCCK